MKCINLDFLHLKCICYSTNQCISLWRSSCNLIRRSSHWFCGISWCHRKFSKSSSLTHVSRSVIHIKNKTGPNTDSCGTLLGIMAYWLDFSNFSVTEINNIGNKANSQLGLIKWSFIICGKIQWCWMYKNQGIISAAYGSNEGEVMRECFTPPQTTINIH